MRHDKRDPETGTYAPDKERQGAQDATVELDQAAVLAGAAASILRAIRALQERLDHEAGKLRQCRPQDKPRRERRVALLALQLRRLTSGLAEGKSPEDDGRIRLVD